MQEIPDDKTIAEQIQAAIDNDGKLKQCIMCRHYDRASGYCDETRMMKMMPYVRGCNGRFFETAMEFLVNRTKQELRSEALECDKMDNMFALSITTANSASCFFTRLHKMIKDLRKKEQNPTNKRLLYKDLETVEAMQRGVDMIREKLSDLYETLDRGMEEVDGLYRVYVEPQLTKLFTTKGKYDVKQSDGHLNNSLDFCELLTKFTIVCINNEENWNTIFSLLDSLTNPYPYALTKKDAESFRIKR